MKRLTLIAALLATAAFAGEALFDALAQRPAGEGAQIIPDGHLRRWDPITVFFTQPQVKAAGAEARPERFMRLRPAQPGAYEWLDTKTLQFRPAAPWTPLTLVEVEAGGATARLSSLLQPPIEASPSEGEVSRKPASRITLTFRGDTAPMTPEALASVVRVEVEALASDDRRALTAEDFTIKRLQRASAEEPLKYTLLFKSPIPLGRRVTLRLGLSLEARREAAYQLRFETAAPFEIEQLACERGERIAIAAGATLSKSRPITCDTGALSVRFTAQLKDNVDPLMARNLLRFDPAVEGLTWSSAGDRLEARGAFERERLYALRLTPTPLTDKDNRPLELAAPVTAWLRFKAPNPRLSWGEGAGLLELHGPKHLPIEGQGIERADLRIYRVDPLSRDLWPLNGTLSVDETIQPPTPGYRPTPWAEALNMDDDDLLPRLRALGTPSLSTLVDLPLKAEAGHAGLDLAAHLQKIEGRVAPGHYLVGLRRLDQPTREWRRVQITDLSLATVEGRQGVRFVVTRLADSAPVSGATVRLEGRVGPSWKSRSWGTIFEGQTDKAGMLDWPAPGDALNEDRIIARISVIKGKDTLVLNPARAPAYFEDGHWRGVGWRGWMAWALERRNERAAQPERLAHVFTERPIYRPEHEVHIGGWVRDRFKGEFTPVSGPAYLEIINPEGQSERLDITLGEQGEFYLKWSREAPETGLYRIYLRDKNDRFLRSQSFRIEAYRLPRFKVDLVGPKTVPSDRPFGVDLMASYFAGGKVVGRPLRWRVTQFPYRWTPKARAGFLYSSDGRYSRVRRFEASPELTQQEKTNAEGGAHLDLDPSIEPNASPRTYVVEATVTGADDQTVTTTHRVNAVPAFAVGLKIDRFLPKAKALEPELIVADAEGALIAGQRLEVRLLHRQWHAHLQASDFADGEARYITEIVDEEVLKQVVHSQGEPLKLSLPIAAAGVYIIEASATDKLGRAQVVAVDLYAGGEGAVGWQKPEAGVFTVSPDQPRYAPGEQAHLTLRSPFQEAEALIIVEAPEGNQYHWRAVRQGQATFDLPIDRRWMPKVPVHVMLSRGRVAAPDHRSNTDPGRPKTLAATRWIEVQPVDHQIDIELKHPEERMPGQAMDLEIKLKDPKGAPLSGAVTLWLVDAAILTLAQEQRLDPLDDFITTPQSVVQIRDARNLVLGHIPFSEMPGGDGGMDDDMAGFDRLTVRKDFKPVPYFAHALEVGAAGRTVQITLPDNLTRFAIRAKAISGPDRFGAAKSAVDVRLPVLVQPALPRFVRPGDQLIAAGIGRVVSGEGGAAAARLTVEGAVVRGETTLHLTLPKAAPARLEFPLEVPAAVGEAIQIRLGLIRAADQAGDAFEVRLPVREDQRWQTAGATLRLKAGEVTPVPLPQPEAREGQVERRLVFSTHEEVLAALAGLASFEREPVYTTEQILSRASAYLALKQLDDLLDEGSRLRLEAATEAALRWLPLVTNDAGRVAHWPGGGGSVTLTARALIFIVEAKAAGIAVSPELERPLIRALRQALRSDYGFFVKGADWYERAQALAALAAAGQLQEAYFSELAGKARFVGLAGQAALIHAALDGGRAQDPLVARLVKQLLDGVQLRRHEGRMIYAGLANLGAYSPEVFHCETLALAEMTRALLRLGVADPKVEAMVNALVALGREGGWGSTANNAAALKALSARLKQPGGLVKIGLIEPGFNREVQIHADQPIGRDVSPRVTPISLLSSGAVSGLARLRYRPAGAASSLAPEAAGLIVEREILILRDGQEISRARLNTPDQVIALKLGDVVETRVRVINPSDRHFVGVEAPLAAGMEPLNPGLATAPPEAKPSQEDSLGADHLARLDDRIFWAFEVLPKGSYDFFFRSRAAFEGRFIQPPAWAEALYTPAERGRSAGAVIEIRR
ncbi:hypothetical protein KKB55_15710 [Myxococcota bacterium]|nr:hypothetical protein [Myxococcota bacterium]